MYMVDIRAKAIPFGRLRQLWASRLGRVPVANRRMLVML